MYIRMKHLILKNFLSYGNAETKFEFSEGLFLVTAKNGGGKSSLLLDGLSFNLYGRPYRKVKLEELINRKNKKGLYTESCFVIDEKDEYRIVRTLAPQKLFIYKNGSDKPMESASSKALDQEEIVKILGLEYDLFKLVIAIATNYNEPFLSLGLPKKREVMESIFSIKVFGEMLQKARKKINSIETDRTIYSSNIKNLESFIVSLKKQITDTENSIKDFDQKKEEELVTLNSRKEIVLNQISEINSALETLEEKIKEIKLDETDYSTKQINLNTAIKTDENSIKEKKSQIKFLDKGDVCPLCSNVITEEHKATELLKLNSSITELEKKIESNKKKLVTIAEKVTEQKKAKTLYDNSKNDLNLGKMKVSNFQKNVIDIDSQIKTVTSRELNLDVTSIKDDYEKKVETYKNDSKELTRLNKDHFNYKIVAKMLAEDGIKSFFFKMLVPILNAKINEYLNLFDLPVSISFDETMKDTISAIGTNEKDISYMAFSEGEKKRIDIAILLSFIGVTKSISNWNCNILVFDEILDSATDIDGLEKLLTSIKEMSTNDPKLCSYVISHRDAFQDIYTGIVRIHKVGGFSKIEIST